MVSACLVLPPAWLDFDCAVSEVVATIALLFFYALSLSSLVARLIGFFALGIQLSSKVTNRLGPSPLVLGFPWILVFWFPHFHRNGRHAGPVPRRCTVTHIRPFRYFGVSRVGPVLTRSGCGTRSNALLLVSDFAPS